MPERRRATGVTIAAVLTIGALSLAACSDSSATTATTTTPRHSVATVTKRDLSQTKSETGTVGYGNADTVKLSGSSSAAEVGATTTTTTVPVASTRTGTAAASTATATAGAATGTGAGATASASPGVITSLAAVDSVVDRNGSLVEINGYPAAVLMFGDRPMWRTLQEGVPDGPDVEQLEENLAALGYDGFTVDQSFTSGTAAAVEKWQDSLGLPETGVVLRDDVAFLPGSARIAGWDAQPGDAATGAAVTVTSTERIVTVDLAQADAGLATPGATASITPASGPAVTGTIFTASTETASSSGSGATGGSGGASSNGSSATTTTHVTIVVPRDAKLGDGSVTVDFTTSTAAGVLAVPVKALLALAEGGYAVERVEGSGTKLVAVTPGSFADGYVQVTGAVQEGDRVVVP